MGAFTYPRSEPGSGGHLDLVERLNANSSAVRGELAGLPDAALAYRPGENEWSILDVVAHLCDHAGHLCDRVDRIIKLEDPRLPGWDQIAELERRRPQAAGLSELLDELMSKRAETVDMLAELVHWNWARTGRHEERGRLSIRQLVDRALAHDDAHLAQLRSLKEAAPAAAS